MSERTDGLALVPETFDMTAGITAGFSLRHGGASPAPYRSLNLGLSTGDEESNVRENRRRLFELFDIGVDRLAIAGQVHGSEVRHVREPGLYPGFDGLVTGAEDIALCITSADCAVVLLADADRGVIGACHSGWRGTVAEITGKTLEAMIRLGAAPSSVRAYIGPSISAEYFEVGQEVAAQFDDRFVTGGVREKPHVDLKRVINSQLVSGGVPEDAIEISARCTFRETDHFFSYRGENGRTGRMMGFIHMRNDTA